MKTLLAISIAALFTTVGCATRNYDARGGTSSQPEYQTGTDQVPTVPDRKPDAWDDQRFPHAQHY